MKSFPEKKTSSKFTVRFTKEIKQKMREIAKTCEIQAKSLVFSLFLSEIENFKIICENLFSSDRHKNKSLFISNLPKNVILQYFMRKCWPTYVGSQFL